MTRDAGGQNDHRVAAYGHDGDAARWSVAFSGTPVRRGQRSSWALFFLVEGVGRRGIGAVPRDGTPLLRPA